MRSAKSIASAFCTDNLTFDGPCAAISAFPASTASAEMSIPSTCLAELASAIALCPCAQPYSSTTELRANSLRRLAYLSKQPFTAT